MWVQEGGDCKEADDTLQSSSLFGRLYSSTKKKQTYTTIGIPMARAKSKPKAQDKPQSAAKPKSTPKQIAEISNTSSEEKDEEEILSTKHSDIIAKVKSTPPPMSPAEFLENIGKSKKSFITEDTTNDLAPFSIGNVDEDSWSEPASDAEINHNVDVDITMDDGKELDLTIIGKKLQLFSSEPTTFDNSAEDDDDQETDFPMKTKEGDQNQHENENKDVERDDVVSINDDESNVVYIEGWRDWDKYLTFSQQNGLLIIELYSHIFGPSNVMYAMIKDILQKKQSQKIQFVRLSLAKLNQMEEIKEVITDYANYTQTPIPIYIFIQKGQKVDKLQGIKPSEFEQLMDKYSQNRSSRPQSAKLRSSPKKYQSILSARPQSAYLPSKASSAAYMDVVDKENKSTASNVENIRNLIKKVNISPHTYTTKLSKQSRFKSSGMSTQ